MTIAASVRDHALRSVSDSCCVARAVQRDVDRVRRITKDDRSPVTVADFAVQAIVALDLADDDADVHIVGEEHAAQLRQNDHALVREAVVDAVRCARPGVTVDQVLDAIDRCDHDGSAPGYWTLDPVDGTKGFLRGQQYAIALAWIEGGQVELGVMGCPNLPVDHAANLEEADAAGVIYSAERGGGANEHPADDPTSTARPIRAAQAADGAHFRVCESVEAAHSKQSDTARILAHLGASATPVRLDSQCKYAVVARNQADAYLRLPTRADYVEKIWDHAAGSLIATEAGAVVSGISGAPLDFGHGPRLERNRGIICATAALHGRLIEAIRALGIGG